MDILIEMLVKGILALFGVGTDKRPQSQRPNNDPPTNAVGGPAQRGASSPAQTQMQRNQDVRRKIAMTGQQAARQQVEQRKNAIRAGLQQRRPPQQMAQRGVMQPPKLPAPPSSVTPPVPPARPQAPAELADIEAQKDAYRTAIPRAQALTITAANLSKLFQTQPNSVRSAFVLAEILSKPLALKNSPADIVRRIS
jgi:hypothetical protein